MLFGKLFKKKRDSDALPPPPQPEEDEAPHISMLRKELDKIEHRDGSMKSLKHLLGDIHESWDHPSAKPFHLHDHRTVHNPKELAKACENMSDETFNHHVSSRHNDFFNWMKEYSKDPELAERVKDAKNPKQLAAAILEMKAPVVKVKQPEEEKGKEEKADKEEAEDKTEEKEEEKEEVKKAKKHEEKHKAPEKHEAHKKPVHHAIYHAPHHKAPTHRVVHKREADDEERHALYHEEHHPSTLAYYEASKTRKHEEEEKPRKARSIEAHHLRSEIDDIKRLLSDTSEREKVKLPPVARIHKPHDIEDYDEEYKQLKHEQEALKRLQQETREEMQKEFKLKEDIDKEKERIEQLREEIRKEEKEIKEERHLLSKERKDAMAILSEAQESKRELQDERKEYHALKKDMDETKKELERERLALAEEKKDAHKIILEAQKKKEDLAEQQKSYLVTKQSIEEQARQVRQTQQQLEALQEALANRRSSIQEQERILREQGFSTYAKHRLAGISAAKPPEVQSTTAEILITRITNARNLLAEGRGREAKELYTKVREEFYNSKELPDDEKHEIYNSIRELYTDIALASLD